MMTQMIATIAVILLTASKSEGQSVCTQLKNMHYSICSGQGKDKIGSENVNCGDMEKTIEERLLEDLETAKRNISELSEALNHIHVRMEKAKRHGFCHVFYDGVCIIFLEKQMRFGEAKIVCESRGWKLANVYSEDHFDQIIKYMRTRIPAGETYWRYWSGTNIDTNTRKVTLSDGSAAPFLKWHPGFPKTENFPYVVWQVKLSPNDPTQFMFNNDATTH